MAALLNFAVSSVHHSTGRYFYAWRGDSDRAFSWLNRAADQRDIGIHWAKSDPLLRTIRSDPRWKPFLRRVNLPVD